MSQARKHMWAAWALSSEELASQAADTLIGLGMLVPEGGAAELERLRREVESSCVDGARLIRAEQRTAELEAVLGTHRKDDQAVIERLRARIAALEAEVAEYEQPADEDPIAYVLTEKAEEPADKLTRLIAPAQALREDDGYESPLRHDYRVGHDLPETGGAR